MTSNIALARAPGNVLVKKKRSGLRADSVVNVSSLYTIDKEALSEPLGTLTSEQIHSVDEGLRLVLSL
jgi:mRNA interferase MazF